MNNNEPLLIRIEASSFLEKSHPSGVGQYSQRLSAALALNKDVLVELTCGPFFTTKNLEKRPSGLQTFLNKSYRKLSTQLPLPSFDSLRKKADATIFPNFFTLPSSSKLTVGAVHDLSYLFYPNSVEGKNLAFLKRVIPRTVQNADLLLTVSESVKKELFTHLNIDPKKCIVTHPAPDEKFFTKNRNDIRKKYGIKTGKYILFVGNLEPRKRVDVLLSAYQELPTEIRHSHSLVIAGSSGWNTDDLQHKIIEASRSDTNIVRLGYVDNEDISALYQQATIFVFPSAYEGFGMPILEAMASRVPVVAADIPVLHEAAGDAALYFSPNDEKALSDTILTVLNSQDIVNGLVKSGEKHVLDFNWSNSVSGIIKSINEELEATK